MSIRALSQSGNYCEGNRELPSCYHHQCKVGRKFFNETFSILMTRMCRVAVEEKLKWRQDENDNDGESAPATTAKSSSPTSMAAAMLSRNSARHSQNHNVSSLGKNAPPDSQIEPPPQAAAVLGSPNLAKGLVVPNYYVVLEKSPPRACNDDSDTSTYDNSFHCRETDICQDSTDYDSSSGGDDSFTTEGIATVDIVEYEVASASDDDANSVNNSSSGTDDHGLVMAAVTALDTTSSSSDFADSEESDSDKLFDRELTDADYWECIQCKNSHNNPLYRMCEKCYKLRRTHFPPRPRFRRKRLNRRQKLTGSLTETTMDKMKNEESMSSSQGLDDMSKRLCTSMIGKEGFNANYRRDFNSFKKRKLNPNNKSQLNSAAETSEEDLSDIEHRSKNFDGAGHRKRKSPLNRNRRDNLSTNVSSSGQSSLSTNKILDSSLSRKRKLSTVDTDINPAKQTRTVDLTNISNMDTASDTDNDTMSLLNNCSNTQKDSGISSALSSQEAPSSSLSDERSVEKDEYIQQSTEKTISEPLAKVVPIERKSNTDDEKTSSTLISEMKPSNLIRSVSDCSSTLLNNNLGGESFSMNMNNLDSNLSSYGSCIICLSGPKNGVFVHSRSLHLCSCYKCAVKIWSKYKRCPVCNSSVKNVLKLFVH